MDDDYHGFLFFKLLYVFVLYICLETDGWADWRLVYYTSSGADDSPLFGNCLLRQMQFWRLALLHSLAFRVVYLYRRRRE